MYPYHNRLKQLLRTHPYTVEVAKPPFAYRFAFPTIGKSIPIRPHRVDEYKEYIENSKKEDNADA